MYLLNVMAKDFYHADNLFSQSYSVFDNNYYIIVIWNKINFCRVTKQRHITASDKTHCQILLINSFFFYSISSYLTPFILVTEIRFWKYTVYILRECSNFKTCAACFCLDFVLLKRAVLKDRNHAAHMSLSVSQLHWKGIIHKAQRVSHSAINN